MQSWFDVVVEAGGVGRGDRDMVGGDTVILSWLNMGRLCWSDMPKKVGLAKGELRPSMGENISGWLCMLDDRTWLAYGEVESWGMLVNISDGVVNIRWSSLVQPLRKELVSEKGDWLPSNALGR